MNDLLTIKRKDGQKQDFKILCIIENKFEYIVYTDIDNNNIKENIYVAKTINAKNGDEILPMSNVDWKIVNKEYQKLLDK